MEDISVHKPVLLHETIEGLGLKNDDIVLDGTVGGAGHAIEILRRLGPKGVYIGLDQDADALNKAKQKFDQKDFKAKIILRNENDRNLRKVLDALDIKFITKAIFDLGLSSDQLEASGRGFSLKKDEPLLMTFQANPDKETLTAETIVNHFENDSLVTILRNYGEEQYAKRIAAGIIRAREEKAITSTGELVRIIEASVPASYRRKKIHPATKTFQALRMTVNDEYRSLIETLDAAVKSINETGRIAIISFESITDRAVKNFFREKKKENILEILNKKPIVPSEQEIKDNPRSRSAKLRIAEKKTIL